MFHIEEFYSYFCNFKYGRHAAPLEASHYSYYIHPASDRTPCVAAVAIC